MSEIRNKKEMKKEYPNFTEVKVNGNKIEISADYAVPLSGYDYYGCYDPNNRKEECIMGYQKLYLTYQDQSLIIDKIEYTPNDKFIKTYE